MEQDRLENPQLQNVLLMAVMKKLDGIEQKLEKKVAYLSTEEAVIGFLKHLREGVSRKGRSFRKPRNYEYLMDTFEANFTKKNICVITAEEIAEFVNKTWESASPGTIRSLSYCSGLLYPNAECLL